MTQNPEIVLITLGRYGDIINCLPIAHRLHKQGRIINWVVADQFKEMLEAVAYVKPTIYKGEFHDLSNAVLWARKQFPETEIIVPQVCGNSERRKNRVDSFCLEMYKRAGMLELFHELPVVFDNRDRAAERKLVSSLKIDPDKPTLGINLQGCSSPFRWQTELTGWVRKTFGEHFNIIDFQSIHAQKIHHMLGVLEECDVLLSADTYTLHMSAATNTPVIALLAPVPYHRSEPRAHWVTSLIYPEAGNVDYWNNIIAPAIVRPNRNPNLIRNPGESVVPMFHRLINWPQRKEGEVPDRLIRAQGVWDEVTSRFCNWRCLTHGVGVDRSSKTELNDTRNLPFIRDVIELAIANTTEHHDVIVFVNSDISPTSDISGILRRHTMKHRCGYCRRYDVQKSPGIITASDLAKVGSPYVGADMFVFTREWWMEARKHYPDMLYACEGWDHVMVRLMQMYDKNPEITPRCIYHEVHGAFWSDPTNRHSNPGQKYNIELGRKWAIEHGFELDLYPGGDYLFRSIDNEYA